MLAVKQLMPQSVVPFLCFLIIFLCLLVMLFLCLPMAPVPTVSLHKLCGINTQWEGHFILSCKCFISDSMNWFLLYVEDLWSKLSSESHSFLM
jgi:hypothetical protein